jgi:Mg2+/Co2+ transporter CorC
MCSEDSETIEGLVVKAIWTVDRRNTILEMVEIGLALLAVTARRCCTLFVSKLYEPIQVAS